MASVEAFALTVGVFLAKLVLAPIAEALGYLLPIALGAEAVVQAVKGKIRWDAFPPMPAVSRRADLERWREQAIRLWFTQWVVGLLALAPTIYLFVVNPVPQDGSPPEPTPSLTQSLWLIGLALLVIASIIVRLSRYALSAKLNADDD